MKKNGFNVCRKWAQEMRKISQSDVHIVKGDFTNEIRRQP